MQFPIRFVGAMLTAAVAVAHPLAAQASHPPVRVVLNGRELPLPTPVHAENGQALLPMRGYLEAVGAQIEFTPPNIVTARLDDRTLQFTLGSRTTMVNGNPVTMDQPAPVINGTGYIPASFLRAGFDATVTMTERELRISTPSPDRVQVIDGPLNIRREPSLHSPVITAVPVGTVLDVIGRNGTWTHVRLPGARTGWLAAQYTKAPAGVPDLEPVRDLIDGGSAYFQVNNDCLGFAPIIGGRTYVPLREAVQRLGGQIAWDGQAVARYGQHEVRLTNGSRQAFVDGKAVTLDFNPVIANGVMLVTARSLADWFGLPLTWDAERRTAMLRTPWSAAGRATACNPEAPLRAYIIMDAATGLVLSEYRADTRLPVASTTKIMTALLALERGKPDSVVTTSRRAADTIGASVDLRPGERQTLQNMLFGMMMVSGNDAAAAVAEHLAGTEDAFARQMTLRAAELGAHDTVFYTASGLDDHVNPLSTARDMAAIARHALPNPDFRALVSAREYTIPGPWAPRKLKNSNDFVSTYPGATGIKNGWTEKAGNTLVVSAFRGDTELIVVLLGASNRTEIYRQAARLMDHGFSLSNRSWVLRSAPIR